MSVNKYQPHVYVLPEDDANRQLANGFLLHPNLRTRKIQVLPEAGGWHEVLNRFASEHINGMERYGHRFMVLVIDCDGNPDRVAEARDRIPPSLQNRVFIIGSLSQPEALRTELGSYEAIGQALANDCCANTNATWGHALLNHNAAELERLRQHVFPIIFA
jgi:hypothetical protein